MPVTFSKPSRSHEAFSLISDTISKHYPDLEKHEVTVGVLLAFSDGETPAVKLHGYACAATIKITPYVQRVQGIEDAVITLDGALWAGMTDERKAALIDHELMHLEVQFDDEGLAKSDDLGRPKLKMRLHDVQAGWFVEIARRHGEASFEVEQARQIADDHGQLLFGWAEPKSIKLNPKKTKLPKGVDSVTLSSGGRSVTLAAK